MNENDLEFFRKILDQQLDDLVRQGARSVSLLLEQENVYPDPTDRASVDEDRNMTLRIRDRESKLIRKIKSALERIAEGEFGICESCGEDIGMERLKARPVTTQCIKCKTRAEARERVTGD